MSFSERGGKTLKPERRSTRHPSRFETLAAVALAMAAAPKAEAQTNTGLEQNPAALHTELFEGSFERDWDVGMYVPWFRDGRVTFEDFGRILEPAYLDVSRKSDKPRTVDFVVPYAYARTFDTGDPIDASHYGEMEGLMADEMRRQLADNVVGLAWDKADYARAGDTRYAGLSVDRISVTGFTSPEATGPGSLEAGSTDPENVELGEIRAGDAGRRLKEVLTRLGVDSVDGIEDISGDEVQFSAEEFSELETIAESLGMNQGTTEDKIYQLLSAYNADRVTDPEVVTRLDQLVASKRFVEVTVTFKEKKKSTTLLPLPLLALLVLALRPLTRRRDAQPQPPIEPAPVGRPRIVDTLPPLDQTDNGLAYARNVEVDINGNFYFYQGIVDRYIENGTVDVNELTHDILEQWNEHDNVRRQNMGQSSIDHRTNPRQVLYAQFHAQALVRLMVEARQRGPHTPVSTVWQDRTVRQGIAQDIIDTLARLQREAAAN